MAESGRGSSRCLIVVAAASIVWRAQDHPEPAPAEPGPVLALTTRITAPCGYRVVQDGGDQPGHVDGAVAALVAQHDSTARLTVRTR